MKIKIISGTRGRIDGEPRSLAAGKVYDVDDKDAKYLIAIGKAEGSTDKKTGPMTTNETVKRQAKEK